MFLDLRRDAYLSVPQALMDGLAPQIRGWRLPSGAHGTAVPPRGDAIELADDLLAAGILCPLQRGTDTRPPLPPPATRDFTSLNAPGSDVTAHGQWVGTFSALASADYALRHLPLWRIAGRISAHTHGPEPDFDSDRLRAAGILTGRFRLIRPWYPRDYLCLFDSLGLTLFLLRRGIRARWIFGVREDPFAAHCWVQYGGVVLNEYLDRTRLYTAIMAV